MSHSCCSRIAGQPSSLLFPARPRAHAFRAFHVSCARTAPVAAEAAAERRQQQAGAGGRGGRGNAQQRRPGKPGGNKGAAAEKQRINKAIAAAGLASRRGADELILAGKVKVNGEVVQEPGMQVDLRTDKLVVEGREVTAAAVPRKFYFAVNKPKGYLCSNRAGDAVEGDARLVVDLLEPWLRQWRERNQKAGKRTLPPRLFTVGRLDVQSVGLIFVTNDGDWANKVMHPSSGITKEYSVSLNRKPTQAELERMAAGCLMDGVFVQPVAVARDDTDPSKQERIRMIVSEGRNREVRNLVEHAGLDVRTLRRLRIGGYRMPRSLAFGQYQELSMQDVRRVLDLGADRQS